MCPGRKAVSGHKPLHFWQEAATKRASKVAHGSWKEMSVIGYDRKWWGAGCLPGVHRLEIDDYKHRKP